MLPNALQIEGMKIGETKEPIPLGLGWNLDGLLFTFTFRSHRSKMKMYKLV